METENVQPKDLDAQVPITDFFEHLESPYPNVYTNINVEKDPLLSPVILLTGFSGSGKDSVLLPSLKDGNAYHVVTAVSRERRVKNNEPENAYIWMRKRRENETEDEYFNNLVKEYSLIEHDVHYGNLYGLPFSSLQKDGEGIPIIRTDIKGVITLNGILPKYGFQPISIGVMPDNWEQVFNAILSRGGENEDQAIKRFKEDVETIDMYKKNINFFIHNSRKPNVNGTSGLDQAVESFKYLLKRYR